MPLRKISGTIRNYARKRQYADFVFDDSDKTKIGAVAIAAGLAGLSGQAISLAAADTTEAADYIEFELDGKPVKGWVWRSPFREGDQVEVAAEWQDDHYEVYAVARPEDRIVALYPHCSRGAKLHVKNAWKWWFWGNSIALLCLFFVILVAGWLSNKPWTMERLIEFLPYFFGIAIPFFYGFFGLMTYSLTRKWMPFVRLAERVFTAFGWDNPGDIDLVKRSKEAYDKPRLAPERDATTHEILRVDEDDDEDDPDPNLPDFLRSKTDEELLREERQRAAKYPEPRRSEEMRRIDGILQEYVDMRKDMHDREAQQLEIKRNEIIDAYGSMYFRY